MMRIRDVVQEADDVLLISLEPTDGTQLGAWEPGAHVEVVLPSGLVRHYSLCGSPNDLTTYSIAVLLNESGRGGSREIHKIARSGAVLSVGPPRNNFPLQPASTYVFLAGGIGLTPILPMIAQAQKQGADWRLVYAARTRSRMGFLGALANYDENRISLRPEDETGRPDFRTELASLPEGARVYACGPAPMLEALENLFATESLKASLHLERFTGTGDIVDTSGAEFDVVLARTGVTVTVGAAQTILEAIRSVSRSTPSSSCEQGYCGTCETTVLDGLPDHRDSYLTEDEREDNDTMMICVSRCLSKRLTLDL
ncbi:oxidoreductase [Paenarthrobacter nitroguajacolicus]|nr:oxidoreductase [Paenarthrobacter nitroguajacolicus]